MEVAMRSMGITAGEHVYELEIDGASIVFTDRGEFGRLEEGIDSIEYRSECAPEDVGCSDCLAQTSDSFVAGLYGEEIMRTVEAFRSDLVEGLIDVALWRVDSDATPRQRSMYWTSIERRYCSVCECGEELMADGVDSVDMDFTREEGADWVFFRTPGGVEVDILSLDRKADITSWDGAPESCLDGSVARSGVDIYLGYVDRMFFRGSGAISMGDA